MASVSVSQLVGKNYFVTKPTKIYVRPEEREKNIIGTAKPGVSVGAVYSWVGGTQGKPLWLQFLTPAKQVYYVLYEPGQIDRAPMRDQGVLTTKEETEKEQGTEKSEAMQLAEKALKYVGLGLIALFAFKQLNK